ncbi:DNA ligase 1-like [Ochlerotatus camptorhynchus]|uniref:DNA ligase 1-like n=1 Tax=Ochlerotatus camptorhynchus TaxID=644619 RepID=UPI0031DDF94F
MANPAPPVLNLTETPCASCDEVSTENEEMIGCDGCQRWYHIRCVGITDAKKEEHKLNAMEEKQKRMEQELEMEMKIKKNEMEFKRSIEMKRMLLEKQLREEEEEEKLFQEEILKQQKEQLNRMKAGQQSFADKMKELDEAMSETKNTEKKRATKDVDAGEGTSGVKPKLRHSKIRKLTEQNLKKLRAARYENSDEDDEDETADEMEDDQTESGEESDGVSEKSVITTNSKSTKKSGRLSQHGLGQARSGPTRIQL